MKGSPEDARLGCEAASGCESAAQAWPSWAARRHYLLRASVSWQGQVKRHRGCARLCGPHQALSCLCGSKRIPLAQGLMWDQPNVAGKDVYEMIKLFAPPQRRWSFS